MTKSESSGPPESSDITSQEMALKALKEHRGPTILRAEYADKIAGQFNVELSRQIGEVEPISNLDRIQPDNDDLGIGVGTLCMKIAENIDSVDHEEPQAAGHGTTQRLRKEKNVEKLNSKI